MAFIGKKNKGEQSDIPDAEAQVTPPPAEAKVKVKKNDPANLTWKSPVRPSALLLPKYLLHRHAMATAKKRGMRLVIYGVLVLAVLCSASFVLRLKAEVMQSEAEGTKVDAQAQLKRLGPESAFFAGLDSREKTIRETLAADVDYSKVIGAINDAVPAGGTISSMGTQFGTSCPGPDPFLTVQSIGCVNFTAQFDSAAAMESFISRANSSESGNVVSFLAKSASTDGEGGGYSIVGTANFTDRTFTHRFSSGAEAPVQMQADGTPVATPQTAPIQGAPR